MSNGEGNDSFERKHHGKTQSHVVSDFSHTLETFPHACYILILSCLWGSLLASYLWVTSLDSLFPTFR